jgi:hypothetical protein
VIPSTVVLLVSYSCIVSVNVPANAVRVDDYMRFGHRCEDVTVQAFVAELAVTNEIVARIYLHFSITPCATATRLSREIACFRWEVDDQWVRSGLIDARGGGAADTRADRGSRSEAGRCWIAHVAMNA